MDERLITRPQFDVPPPSRMRTLPRDHRGYLVPKFVAWMDDNGRVMRPGTGRPDFRVLDPGIVDRCLDQRLCWLCGHQLGRLSTFAVGPMCTVSRVTSEPSSHHECAVYAVKVCPFMLRPAMRRNENDLPEHRYVAGVSIARNPGVTALWTSSASAYRFRAGRGDLLALPHPERVEWYREGRPATRAEVEQSIVEGMPQLEAVARLQGADALEELERAKARFPSLLPA